jgi:hypothetical protein
VSGLFFTVMACRFRRRHSVPIADGARFARSRACISARVMSGVSSIQPRITSAQASIRCECRSPPICRASTRPVSRQHATQSIAVERPTPKRRAAALAEEPSSTAKITRRLRSFKSGLPIHTDLLTVISVNQKPSNLGIPYRLCLSGTCSRRAGIYQRQRGRFSPGGAGASAGVGCGPGFPGPVALEVYPGAEMLCSRLSIYLTH